MTKTIQWTSAKSYHDILDSGVLGKMQKEVYTIMAEEGRAMTPGEISAIYSRYFPDRKNAARNEVAKRIYELRKSEAISRDKARKCEVSGVVCWSYVISGKTPKSIDRPKPLSIQLEEALYKISELEHEIRNLERKVAVGETIDKMNENFMWHKL